MVQLRKFYPRGFEVANSVGLTLLGEIQESNEKQLENWQVIADAVKELIKRCRLYKGDGAGQIEFQDGWSALYHSGPSNTC